MYNVLAMSLNVTGDRFAQFLRKLCYPILNFNSGDECIPNNYLCDGFLNNWLWPDCPDGR